MTIAYFDSSALVKLVIEEPGSEDAALLWDGADAVVTSRIAHPEVRAALAAAHRDARLDATAHRQAKAEWDAFHQALRMVELTPQLETEAADLAEQHALSGFDAVHLASALTFTVLPIIVAAWDARLLGAASSSGLDTDPCATLTGMDGGVRRKVSAHNHCSSQWRRGYATYGYGEPSSCPTSRRVWPSLRTTTTPRIGAVTTSAMSAKPSTTDLSNTCEGVAAYTPAQDRPRCERTA